MSEEDAAGSAETSPARAKPTPEKVAVLEEKEEDAARSAEASLARVGPEPEEAAAPDAGDAERSAEASLTRVGLQPEEGADHSENQAAQAEQSCSGYGAASQVGRDPNSRFSWCSPGANPQVVPAEVRTHIWQRAFGKAPQNRRRVGFFQGAPKRQ